MIPYRSHDYAESVMSLLRPEDAKRHAEAAWRYIWARNAVVASRLWRKYHPGEAPPEGCVLVEQVRAAA